MFRGCGAKHVVLPLLLPQSYWWHADCRKHGEGSVTTIAVLQSPAQGVSMKLARMIHFKAINAAKSAVPPMGALPRPSWVPLSFPHQGMWFVSRPAGGSEARNTQMGLRLRGELDDAALQAALDALMARHEVTFGVEGGEPFLRVGPADVGLPLKRDDLKAAANVEATLADLMRDEGQFAFDLEAGPLIRGRVIRLAVHDHMLVITRSTVERFVNKLQQASTQMAADPGQRVWSAPLLLAEERHRLLIEPNSTESASPQAPCIPQLPEAQTGRDAEAIALDRENQGLTEHELNARVICPPQAPPINSDPGARTVVMNFIEGTRVVTQGELQANSITRYQVTKFYREQIKTGGYYDQLRYIVEPTFDEFKSPGNLDTSGEHDNTVMPGLQHKYAQTGLLLVTDRCASYCRYCFRKRIVGKDSDEITADFAQIARYISNHPEMTNVLLSGGDPFVLSTAKLNKILDHLLPIPHLDSIRFGTKALGYEPKRFEDPALSALFQRIHETGKTSVIVTHFDHIGEISVETERNIRSLRAQGVQFLNQSVLLAKINDDPEILAATFAKCHQMGVRPYYLFQARPVKGASHFQVPLRRGLDIAHGINQRLSGIQKTFKYIMSHYTGKIEILDLGADGRVYMRYHQNKTPGKIGKIFSRAHREGACWLDDVPEG